jgi:hypothetical protein
VYVCHFDFCQRRSGNVFIASASFAEDQVVSISGETGCYNGLEIDGVSAVGIPGGINFRFCAVCASSIYFDMIYPPTGGRFFTIALGCFVDPVFSPPTTEFNTKFRHPWVAPIPGALQLYDPMGLTRKPRGERPTHEATDPTRSGRCTGSRTPGRGHGSSGGCSRTRGRYSTSWVRPSKVRWSIISRATSG